MLGCLLDNHLVLLPDRYLLWLGSDLHEMTKLLLWNVVPIQGSLLRRCQINLFESCQVLQAKIEPDWLWCHFGEALEANGLRWKVGWLVDKVAPILLGVGLDQSSDCACDLWISNATTDVVEDILNVLETGYPHSFNVAEQAGFKNSEEARVQLNQLVYDESVDRSLAASRESVVLEDRFTWLKFLAKLDYPGVRLNLLGLKLVVVHAVSAQDLKLDCKVLWVDILWLLN